MEGEGGERENVWTSLIEGVNKFLWYVFGNVHIRKNLFKTASSVMIHGA